MGLVFKDETFRDDFTFSNSPAAIRRFPFPFHEDAYMYAVNIEPHVPGPKGSVYEFPIDIDEHYVSEMRDRALVLEKDPLRCQALPHMMPAQWDMLELLMTSMSSSYPEHFTLDRNGDQWHWINRPLHIEQRFTFGDPATLPYGPMEYIGRQCQGDFSLQDQRDNQLYMDAGIITTQADWSLDFDVGMNFTEWHGPVPLAHKARVFERALKFLLNLQLGHPVRRLNWTMTINPRLDTSPENFHKWGTDRMTVTPENVGDKVHLRVEVQGLWRLPRSNAILFSIRCYLLKMSELVTVPKWARRFPRVLGSLPPELVDYKGLTRYRDTTLAWLAKHDDGAATSAGCRPDEETAAQNTNETIARSETPMTANACSRQSVLNDRHRALGSDLSSSWNDMPIPKNYKTDPYEETAAVRYRAGLFDVSMLKMLNVSGSGALAFLNDLLTSDVSKAKPGDSHISNIVNEAGALVDDVIVYVDGPNQYRISHGGGALEEAMGPVAAKYDVKIQRDNDVHILSLQGPLALEALAPHTPMNLAGLGYFRHEPTSIFGKEVRIARGGYSAERGYEIFCSAADAHHIWDAILVNGAAEGIIPVSWACLDIVRVEGALLFFPFDMPHGDTTPWEVRADWTVDLSKPNFVGKEALNARKGQERSFISGLEIATSRAIEPGAKITAGGKQVGVITSTTFSKHLMKSIALAQLEPGHTKLGTELVVHDGGEHAAVVVKTPFYDPERLRTHPAHV
jgi:glycine cleavage system T protein